MQFRNLKGSEIAPSATARFVFYGISGEPWIMVRAAHETNKPYFNAVLKRVNGSRRRPTVKVIDAATIERNRAEDREMFAKFITNVGEWGNWVGEDGSEIPYTQAAMETLINQALPNDQFDEMRQFCTDLSNFRQDIVSAEDAEEVGKNS